MRGFALSRIVVGVALEAARLRGFAARVMARAAPGDAGHEHVGALLAGKSGGMATGAVYKPVL